MSRAKQILRKGALNALYLSGLHHALAPRMAGSGAVLMFHHVRPDRAGDFAPNAHLEVTPEFLEAVIVRVREQGRDIVDLDEAKRRLVEGDRRPFVAITFDDGYRDNFDVAYPILKRLNAPFTIYVATGLIDRTTEMWWTILERVIERQDSVAMSIKGPVTYLACRTLGEKREAFDRILTWLRSADEDHQREAVRELAWRYRVDSAAILDEEMMDWDEVKAIAADPLVTIGAHTVGHFALAKLPLQRATAEVRDGAKILEAVLGQRPRHFAYPYGYPSAAGPREFKLVADLGFDTAVTTRPGVLTAGAATQSTAWPRLSMNGHFQAIRYVDVLLSGAPFATVGRLVGTQRRAGKAPALNAAPSRQ